MSKYAGGLSGSGGRRGGIFGYSPSTGLVAGFGTLGLSAGYGFPLGNIPCGFDAFQQGVSQELYDTAMQPISQIMTAIKYNVVLNRIATSAAWTMVEQRATLMDQRYESAWRDLRIRERVWIAVFISLVAFHYLAEFGIVPKNGVYFKAIEVVFFCVAALAVARAFAFRCPRCGNRFFISRTWTSWTGRRCLHCNLARGGGPNDSMYTRTH